MIARTELSALSNCLRKNPGRVSQCHAGGFWSTEPAREKFRISVESKVDYPLATIKNFNRQFQLGKVEQEAVDWGYGHEPGGTMFSIVNTYTRAAQFRGLSAESGYRLQKV